MSDILNYNLSIFIASLFSQYDQFRIWSLTHQPQAVIVVISILYVDVSLLNKVYFVSLSCDYSKTKACILVAL